MRKGLLLLSALMMLLASCRKDIEEITIIDTGYQPPIVAVNGSVLGLVMDEEGEPLANAMVRLGSEVSITNAGGIYRFENTTLNARGTYITVNKAGYFHGSKRFYPRNNTTTAVDIQLLPLRSIGTISGANGGSVSFEGAKIELPAGGVVDAQNRTYTGEVQVAAHWLNPTANNLDLVMPGNLEGVTQDNRQVGMATFGMLAVELLSTSGEVLQVAPGRKAKLTFPVPAEIANLAPAEIPLWHFNEALGLWEEEGQASLQGSNYVGEVSHFSFWNCDVPYPLITLSGRLIQLNGVPVGNQRISIFAEGIGRTGYGITAADGTFTGLVPANAVLTLTIMDACPELVIAEIGPFSEDTDYGEILVADETLVEATGTIVDCSGNGVANGSVRISWSDRYVVVSTDEDGFFYYSGFICEGEEITVQAYDVAALNETEPVTQPVSNDVDFGEIVACDNPISEFIDFNFDGESDFFIAPRLETQVFSMDSITFDTIFAISAGEPTTDSLSWRSIYLNVPQLDLGEYVGEGVSFSYNEEGSATGFIWLQCQNPCESVTVTITRNDGPGGYLQGNYTGTVSGFSGNQEPVNDAPVSGSFSVLIE